MNNPFDYTPDKACEEAFRRLIVRVETLKKSNNPDDINFCRDLEAGKMIGVLVAADAGGLHHTLYAFSGQIGDAGFHFPGFVAPVFDYLRPDGYFKRKEAEISRQNKEISWFEETAFTIAKTAYDHAKESGETEIKQFKEMCQRSKTERRAKREAGTTDKDEIAEMIRRSQFEKAELHRLKKRVAEELKPFEIQLKEAQIRLETMKARRRSDSEALQDWLFTNFRLLNARGESKSLSEIFADTPMRMPPSGAGECCAPKLLQSAYLRGWKPIAMAEYWYGSPKGGEMRRHGQYYPACRGKCLPVLCWMLQGLPIEPPLNSQRRVLAAQNPKIIYENAWFCVVDKPSGMLSVPGKSAALSVEQWLKERYGGERTVRMAHRLDQDTSGLLLATFSDEVYKTMQALFATRRVTKTYVAELEGDYEARGLPRKGLINLPLSPDWLDRPRQRIDLEAGKSTVTEYEFTGVSEGRSRIIFHPLTGRTHQLRVHSASEQGLGLPIAGDPLYGINGGRDSYRLLLHAHKLEFTFPLDGQHYSFESPVPF